jgi:hypothetical protein
MVMAPNGGLGAYQMPGMQNFMAAQPDNARTFFNPFTSGHPMSEMTWLPPANPKDPRSTGTWQWNPREDLARIMAPQQLYGRGPNWGSQGGSHYGGYTTSGPQSGSFGYGGGQGGWGRGSGGGRSSASGGVGMGGRGSFF